MNLNNVCHPACDIKGKYLLLLFCSSCISWYVYDSCWESDL